MAMFDVSKVISTLNKDKAEIGKRYWYSYYIGMLKERVESDNIVHVEELIGIYDDNHCCFNLKNSMYELLYPYEEPSNQRMTNRQLSEYLRDCSKEYRECLINNNVYSYFTYHSG